MDNNNSSRIQQIIAHLAGAASVAADGVTDAVQTASNAVGDKYDSMKLTIEIHKLQEEQSKLFAEIGRALFMVKTSEPPQTSEDETQVADAQGEIDQLLDSAIQKQSEIDEASDKLAKLNNNKVCAKCGKNCDDKDLFCSSCGAELPQNQAKEAED